MQGMFNTCPPRPRYTSVWDVEIVIRYIEQRPLSGQLDLKELSWKLVTLFALSNADRASDLHLLDLKFRSFT